MPRWPHVRPTMSPLSSPAPAARPMSVARVKRCASCTREFARARRLVRRAATRWSASTRPALHSQPSRRVDTGRPTCSLRTTSPPRAPATAWGRPSRSSTRSTMERPRPISRFIAASSGCPRAPRPTDASARSIRTAARDIRAATRGGPRRSRSISTWPARSAPSARSSSSRRATTPSPISPPQSTARP